jgi:hypothetical protein
MHGLQSTGNALSAPAVAFHAALWPLCIFVGSEVREVKARAAVWSEERLGLALRVPGSVRCSSSSTAPWFTILPLPFDPMGRIPVPIVFPPMTFDVNIIVQFADITFAPDYFERLMAKFAADPTPAKCHRVMHAATVTIAAATAHISLTKFRSGRIASGLRTLSSA